MLPDTPADADAAPETGDSDDADAGHVGGASDAAPDGSLGDAGPPAPARPVMWLSEMMLRPCSAEGPSGQWLEFSLTGTGTLPLDGWSLEDGSGGQWFFPAGTEAAAGDRVVVGASTDRSRNGDAPVSLAWEGLALSAPAGRIRLRAPEGLVGTWDYDVQGLESACASVSLSGGRSPLTVWQGAAWCASTVAYGGAGNFGTPGAENPPCPGAPQEVDWCRLQFPLDLTLDPAETRDAFVRVFADGITNRSPAVDEDPALRVELGVGPRDELPSADTWRWIAAAPNPGWTDTAEPGNDEYMATLTAPSEPGAWDFAFRATRSDGRLWLYCDRNAGPGADGAANGFQIANAGKLVVRGPCDGVVCESPPAAECVDASTRRVWLGPGTCSLVEGAPTCSWTETEDVCGSEEEPASCVDGACIPETVSIDWCRLQFPRAFEVASGGEADVYGRVFVSGWTDRTTRHDLPAGGPVIAQAGFGPANHVPDDLLWTWFDASPTPEWDAAAAGEPANDEFVATMEVFTPPGERDVAFRFSGNGGVDWVFCDLNQGPGRDGVEDGYSPEDAGRMTVVPALDGPCAGPEECPGPEAPSCDGPLQVRTPRAVCEEGLCAVTTGTTECAPGEVCDGGLCVARSWTPAYCRLQFPLEVNLPPGGSFDAYGVVYAEGLTDRSRGVDLDPALVAQFGIGPEGSDPATDLTGWTFRVGVATPGWNGAGDDFNNDEYTATAMVPADAAAGESRSFAWRFSGDGGRTWVYCDRGPAGNTDGYRSEDAGRLGVIASD
jgi:hypothetical protein